MNIIIGILGCNSFFFALPAPRDDPGEDRQALSHVSSSEPRSTDGLGLSPTPCNL